MENKSEIKMWLHSEGWLKIIYEIYVKERVICSHLQQDEFMELWFKLIAFITSIRSEWKWQIIFNQEKNKKQLETYVWTETRIEKRGKCDILIYSSEIIQKS